MSQKIQDVFKLPIFYNKKKKERKSGLVKLKKNPFSMG